MNKIFRRVFNAARGTIVAVEETKTSHTKASGEGVTSSAPKSIAVATLAAALAIGATASYAKAINGEEIVISNADYTLISSTESKVDVTTINELFKIKGAQAHLEKGKLDASTAPSSGVLSKTSDGSLQMSGENQNSLFIGSIIGTDKVSLENEAELTLIGFGKGELIVGRDGGTVNVNSGSKLYLASGSGLLKDVYVSGKNSAFEVSSGNYELNSVSLGTENTFLNKGTVSVNKIVGGMLENSGNMTALEISDTNITNKGTGELSLGSVKLGVGNTFINEGKAKFQELAQLTGGALINSGDVSANKISGTIVSNSGKLQTQSIDTTLVDNKENATLRVDGEFKATSLLNAGDVYINSLANKSEKESLSVSNKGSINITNGDINSLENAEEAKVTVAESLKLKNLENKGHLEATNLEVSGYIHNAGDLAISGNALISSGVFDNDASAQFENLTLNKGTTLNVREKSELSVNNSFQNKGTINLTSNSNVINNGTFDGVGLVVFENGTFTNNGSFNGTLKATESTENVFENNKDFIGSIVEENSTQLLFVNKGNATFNNNVALNYVHSGENATVKFADGSWFKNSTIRIDNHARLARYNDGLGLGNTYIVTTGGTLESDSVNSKNTFELEENGALRVGTIVEGQDSFIHFNGGWLETGLSQVFDKVTFVDSEGNEHDFSDPNMNWAANEVSGVKDNVFTVSDNGGHLVFNDTYISDELVVSVDKTLKNTGIENKNNFDKLVVHFTGDHISTVKTDLTWANGLLNKGLDSKIVIDSVKLDATDAPSIDGVFNKVDGSLQMTGKNNKGFGVGSIVGTDNVWLVNGADLTLVGFGESIVGDNGGRVVVDSGSKLTLASGSGYVNEVIVSGEGSSFEVSYGNNENSSYELGSVNLGTGNTFTNNGAVSVDKISGGKLDNSGYLTASEISKTSISNKAYLELGSVELGSNNTFNNDKGIVIVNKIVGDKLAGDKVSNTGTMTAFEISSTSITNNGTLTLGSADLEAEDIFSNEKTGTVHATKINGGTLINAGELTANKVTNNIVSNSGNLTTNSLNSNFVDNKGDLKVNETFEVATLLNSGTANINKLVSSATVTNNGTLRVTNADVDSLVNLNKENIASVFVKDTLKLKSLENNGELVATNLEINGYGHNSGTLTVSGETHISGNFDADASTHFGNLNLEDGSTLNVGENATVTASNEEFTLKGRLNVEGQFVAGLAKEALDTKQNGNAIFGVNSCTDACSSKSFKLTGDAAIAVGSGAKSHELNAGDVWFGSNSVLVIGTSRLGDGLFQNQTEHTGSFTVESGSQLVIDINDFGWGDYVIAKDFGNISLENGWDIKFDNGYSSIAQVGNDIVLTVGTNDITDKLPNLALKNLVNEVIQSADRNVNDKSGKGYLAALIENRFVSAGIQEEFANKATQILGASGYFNESMSLVRNFVDTTERHVSVINGAPKSGLWIEALGEDVEKATTKISGAESKLDGTNYGFALGADYKASFGAVFGATFAYQKGKIDTNDVVNSDNDTDAYSFGIYGAKDFAGFNFLASLGYTRVDADLSQTWSEALNQIKTNHKAEVQSDIFTVGLRAEKGFTSSIGQFTPYVGMRLVTIKTDDVTSTVDGANALNYSNDTATQFQTPVGVALSGATNLGGWTTTGMVDLSVTPVFGDKDVTSTVTVAGLKSHDEITTTMSEDLFGTVRLGVNANKGNFTFGGNLGVVTSGSDNTSITFGLSGSMNF